MDEFELGGMKCWVCDCGCVDKRTEHHTEGPDERD